MERNERIEALVINRGNKIFLSKMPSERTFQKDGRKPHISPHNVRPFCLKKMPFRQKQK